MRIVNSGRGLLGLSLGAFLVLIVVLATGDQQCNERNSFEWLAYGCIGLGAVTAFMAPLAVSWG
jgi:hypothetical protein